MTPTLITEVRKMEDPLGALVVDSKEVDRARLATCLASRVGVDADSGEPVLLDGFGTLKDARSKILCYLLGRKAAALLGKSEEEGAGPTAISAALGMATGTVGRTLRELADARILVQDDRRLYSVPSHQLLTVEAELVGGDH